MVKNRHRDNRSTVWNENGFKTSYTQISILHVHGAWLKLHETNDFEILTN